MARNYIHNEQLNIDLKNDLVAFIDEAGDEGFSDKSSRWFVVSSIVATYQNYQRLEERINEFNSDVKKKKTNISFKKLSHNQRKDLSAFISKEEYTTVHSCFNKFNFTPQQEYLCTYPSMYFVGVKNIIERLSWHTKQAGKNKVHIMVGNRNTIKGSKLAKYLFETSKTAEKNLTYFDKVGKICLGTVQDRGMILSDCVASSMFNYLEPQGVAKLPEPAYYDICLKDTLYSSNHSAFGGVARNGIKCTPDNYDFLK